MSLRMVRSEAKEAMMFDGALPQMLTGLVRREMENECVQLHLAVVLQLIVRLLCNLGCHHYLRILVLLDNQCEFSIFEAEFLYFGPEKKPDFLIPIEDQHPRRG